MKKLAARTTVLFKGEALELYSVGWLAYVCHRTARSIYLWEKAGVMPKPIFDIKDGRRWYCATELVGYNVIVERLTPEHAKDSRNSNIEKLKSAFHEFNRHLREEMSSPAGATIAPKLPIADELAEKISERALKETRERFHSRAKKVLTRIGVLASEKPTPGIRLKKKLA